MNLIIEQTAKLHGTARVPGDKSISHRALMFASLAEGPSHFTNFLNGSDCLATAQVLKQLGIAIKFNSPTEVIVEGKGLRGFSKPNAVLDCQNSGTTIRLLAGLLCGQGIECVLDGSEQIRRRPMGRIIAPLRQMGAQISGVSQNTLAPIRIAPSSLLKGIHYELPVASAQITSAVMLAGLFTQGPTTLIECGPSRDHTERLLGAMGAFVSRTDNRITVEPLTHALKPISLAIPGDISSAAFLLVAACVTKSSLLLTNVGINPTRTGIIDVMTRMGAKLDLQNRRQVAGEPIADIVIHRSDLHATQIDGSEIVRMIDELPILAVLATQAQGVTTVRDAQELKVKETNRIDTTVTELKKMGAHIEATDDGFIIQGPTKLTGTTVSSHGDHRLALALAVAGLCTSGKTIVQNAEVTVDSFPGFEDTLRALGAHLTSVKS